MCCNNTVLIPKYVEKVACLEFQQYGVVCFISMNRQILDVMKPQCDYLYIFQAVDVDSGEFGRVRYTLGQVSDR